LNFSWFYFLDDSKVEEQHPGILKISSVAEYGGPEDEHKPRTARLGIKQLVDTRRQSVY